MALTIPQALIALQKVGAMFSISKDMSGSPLPVVTLPPTAPPQFTLLRAQLMSKKSELLQALEAHCKPTKTEPTKPVVAFGTAKADLPPPPKPVASTAKPAEPATPVDQIGLLHIEPQPPPEAKPANAVSFLNPSNRGENGGSKGAKALTGRWAAPTTTAARVAEFQRIEVALRRDDLPDSQRVIAWARHNVLRNIYTGEADVEGGAAHRWINECGTYEEFTA